MSTSFAKDQPAGFKNYLENIAIVGAGGQSGTYITNALIANGKHKITALTRANSKYPIPEGVHSIKTIDYSDPSTIVEALKGQDALICTLFVHATDEQEKLSRAAAEAGVKWILPNEFGTASTDEQLARDTYIGVGKAKERKLIQDLGVSSWIGVACSFWYEYSLSAGTWTYGFDIKNRAVILFDDGAKQIDTTTLPQVGRGVANLLSLKVLPDDENDKAPNLSQFRNNFVCMSSFRVSQQQMFDSVLRVTGTKREDWNITTESPQARYATGKAMFEGGDRRGFGLLLYSRVFFPDAAGQHPRNDNAALGLAEENLDECTAVAVKMAEEDYFLKHVVPRTMGSNN